jgi:hypothetical protein
MTDTPIFDAEEFLEEKQKSFNLHFEFERITEKCGEKDGMPLYRSSDIVKIHVPTDIGHPEVVPCEPLEYAKRHPEAARKILGAYERWKTVQEQPMNGYPLKHIAGIPAVIQKSFEFLGILTAEQLISANDAVIGKVPNAGQYRDAVRKLMDVSEKKAEAAKLVKENAELLARVAALEKQAKIEVKPNTKEIN